MKKFVFVTLMSFLFVSASSAYDLPQSNYQLFENKNILVLGGTGFLGRAITSQLLKYNPKKIIIFSRDEVKHFNYKKIFENNNIKIIIGDIRDYQTLLHITKI